MPLLIDLVVVLRSVVRSIPIEYEFPLVQPSAAFLLLPLRSQVPRLDGFLQFVRIEYFFVLNRQFRSINSPHSTHLLVLVFLSISVIVPSSSLSASASLPFSVSTSAPWSVSSSVPFPLPVSASRSASISPVSSSIIPAVSVVLLPCNSFNHLCISVCQLFLRDHKWFCKIYNLQQFSTSNSQIWCILLKLFMKKNWDKTLFWSKRNHRKQ